MEIKFKMNNPAIIVPAALVIVAAFGVLALTKPEMFKAMIASLLKTNSEGVIDVAEMRAGLEDTVLLHLNGQLLTEAIDRRATQSEIDALKNLGIISLTAEPRSYYKNRASFEMARKDRHVDFELVISAGDVNRNAKGEALLTRQNRWSFVSVNLLP